MKTYIVFKPETTSRSLLVVSRFLREKFPGIHFATHSGIVISSKDALSLYSDDMPVTVKEETVRRLVGVPLTIIQVSDGDSVVDQIALIRGKNVDPAKCELGTLRKMLFSDIGSEPVDLGGEDRYYPNFVHIPQNIREVAVCEMIFGKYFVS